LCLICTTAGSPRGRVGSNLLLRHELGLMLGSTTARISPRTGGLACSASPRRSQRRAAKLVLAAGSFRFALNASVHNPGCGGVGLCLRCLCGLAPNVLRANARAFAREARLTDLSPKSPVAFGGPLLSLLSSTTHLATDRVISCAPTLSPAGPGLSVVLRPLLDGQNVSIAHSHNPGVAYAITLRRRMWGNTC